MWLSIIGIAVLLAGMVDLLWTTLGTHGGGPISAPLTKLLWKAMTGLHRRSPHHRLLSFGGTAILVWLMSLWVFLVWLAWVLIYCGGQSAIVEANTREKADLVSVIYFVGSTMFTSGTGEYAPNGPLWKLAATLTAASGLFAVTLTIAYLLEVLGATVEKRTVASFIWDMGGTTERIIERAWDGERFTDLTTHLTQLMTDIEKFAEQHLAYPILQYFHAENRRTAAALRLALLLLSEGVTDDVRPPRLLMGSSRDAIRGLSEVLAEEFVKPADQPPARPDLEILRSRGIPTVDPQQFAAAVDRDADVRRRLLGLIEDGGWTWPDVFSMELKA
jgi:hypothetical protein